MINSERVTDKPRATSILPAMCKGTNQIKFVQNKIEKASTKYKMSATGAAVAVDVLSDSDYDGDPSCYNLK
jgi:hypothetical protein